MFIAEKTLNLKTLAISIFEVMPPNFLVVGFLLLILAFLGFLCVVANYIIYRLEIKYPNIIYKSDRQPKKFAKSPDLEDLTQSGLFLSIFIYVAIFGLVIVLIQLLLS